MAAAGWPSVDEAAAREEEIEIPIQVNGKVRARVTLSRDATEGEMQAAAHGAPQIAPYLEGMEIVKTVVANGRLVNIVVKPRKKDA